MNEILFQLSNDLIAVMICYGILMLAYGSNVVFSIWYNTKVLNYEFDKNKLFLGFQKLFSLIVGTLLLVIAIDLVKCIVFEFVDLSSEIESLVTIAMVLMVIGAAIIKYIKEAYQKLIDILSIEK